MAFLPEGMPLPMSDEPGVDGDFWRACAEKRLVVQKCGKCGTLRHGPDVICFKCHSFDYEWKPVSGKGKVWSYINCVYPAHPALKDHGPYNVVLVELDDADGIRMVGNLVNTPFEDIKAGMPVEVHWDQAADDVVLPLWKRAGS